MNKASFHIATAITARLLSATIEDQRAFFSLLKDSPAGMQVDTAIKNFKRKNPEKNTFSGYNHADAVPFLMRAVFSPFTIREAKNAMDELFKIKQNHAIPWPPKLAARIWAVAEQMNSDQHHYLNISEVGVSNFLPTPRKPSVLVVWWDKAVYWSAPHRQVRADFCQGRGLGRFISFPR